MTAAPSLLTAALADRYALERELGRGGTATVYLALDRKHARQVAIKVLRPDLAAQLGAERFLQEIRIAARLTHPHILPLIASTANRNSRFATHSAPRATWGRRSTTPIARGSSTAT